MDEPYFKKYLAYVDPSIRPIDALEAQASRFLSWCRKVDDSQTLVLHGPYTWTFRQVLNHITDSERVFAFRMLWFARGSQVPLPGFDEHEFSSNALANHLDWQALIDEFRTVREATLSLLSNLPPEAWPRGGTAAGHEVDLSLLFGMIYGHVEHHFKILQTRQPNLG